MPLKRKTPGGIAALMALGLATALVPGAQAAVSTSFAPSPALPHATFANEKTLRAASPVTSFDAIWPSLRDVDGEFAQPFALSADATPFAMTPPSNTRMPGIVCSRLASMCLPLADEPLAEGSLASDDHGWSGPVIALDAGIASALNAPDAASAFGLPASEVQSAAGSIDSTLRASLTQAGLPASVATQIETLFAGRVDLDAHAQAGDTFRVMLDQVDGLMTPRIASIALRLQGATYDALWFRAPGAARGAYYTLDGALLAGKPFAMPLDYRRVSSPFGMRTHPVFGEPRFHAGIDLTAPVGTPIHAAATGTLELAASGHGYGKLVVLRHDDGYSTRYAHLVAWASGLRSGQRIEQGEVIGYVGRTGTVTGPHLHFEVRLNERPVDPLTLTSREFVAPLSGTARMAFEARVENARTSLAALTPSEGSLGVRMASVAIPRRVI
ncbi:M23 family metallopeptidase [Paraburkholderia sp. J67]|uniref:M23 family metallopeptidase n=1 Tax=Paraburkholderia sp. J67 TaxID=2805435 RepID=UPI002ABD5D97|nr:M23 family metallopeptidase [Paraburkholderia sp. J67]